MPSKQLRYTSEPSDLYDTSEELHRSGEDLAESDGNDDDHCTNEWAPLTQSSTNLEYESITKSIFAKPMTESSLVRRQRGLEQDSSSDVGSAISNSDVNIETILQEYTSACQIYGCADRINAGILTTLRYRLPSLRVSGSFFDADMLALAEVLLHHVNGALSYIKRLDFSLAAREGKQYGKKGIRSHGAYALSKVLQISKYIEEVFLPGETMGTIGALCRRVTRQHPFLYFYCISRQSHRPLRRICHILCCKEQSNSTNVTDARMPYRGTWRICTGISNTSER